MTHSFDTVIAEKVGINAAVIFYNIQFWIEKNKANEKHFYDGNYWTYNSVKAFSDLFPYLTEKQIRAAISKLEIEGYLTTGNFNKSSYDRTKWYSIPSDKRLDCILPTGQMEEPLKANGIYPQGEPIPDSKPNMKTDDNNSDKSPKQKSFKNYTNEEFIEDIKKHSNLLPKDDLNSFYAYWREKSPSGKMRFQLEKTWETKLRLETWKRNRDKFTPLKEKSENKISAPTLKEFNV